MGPIRFGSCGWRGIIAEDFTFTSVRAVAQAIAEHLRQHEPGTAARGVVVGYDPRFLSGAFAAQVARVMAAQGVKSFLCGRDTPSPVVAFEVLRRACAGGIIITGGGSPPECNGVKLCEAWGGPLTPAATRQIEERANILLGGIRVADLSAAEAERRGLIERIDPRPGYLTRLHELVDLETIQEAHLKVVVDPLYGSAQGYLDTVLRDAGCEVQTLHASRDATFGGLAPEPSEERLKELAFQVVETSAHLGLATDCDAGRFGLVDADGSSFDPNYFLGLLLYHLVRTRGWTGGAGRSIATSHLLDGVARHLGVPTYETPVGFRQLGELIAKGKLVLGGEESARLSVQGHIPKTDGILACLLAAELVASRGGARLKALLQELYAEVGTFLTRRLFIQLEPEAKHRLCERLQEPPSRLADLAVIEVKRQDGVKMILEDGSWLLLRLSEEGPEVRLYAEAATEQHLEALTAAGRELIAASA